MTKRFTTVAGFLAAGTLLSGSAFAFAPEFRQDLPTVIITDKVNEEGQIPGSPALVFDDDLGGAVATTQYVFQNTAAFDAREFFNNEGSTSEEGLQGNTFESIQFRFTESLYNPATGEVFNQQDASEATLSINGEVLFDGIPALPADFTGAPNLNSAYTSADGRLDFRNIDFSPVSGGPYDEIGDVTGQNLIDSPVQYRWVDFFIKGDTSDEVSNAGFLAITSAEAASQDGVTAPVFTTAFGDPVDVPLEGWVSNEVGPLGGLPLSGDGFDFDLNGDVDPFNPNSPFMSFTPGTSPAPAGTTELTIAGSPAAGTTAFGDWGNPNISVVAGTLYRLRANVYSNDIAASEEVRVIFNAGDGGATTTAVGVGGVGSLPTETDTNVDVYLRPVGNNANALVAVRPLVGLEPSIANPAGIDLTIGSVELSEANIEDLGGEAVEINVGASSFSTDTSAVDRSLPGSPSGFNTANTGFLALNSDNTYNLDVAADALTFSLSGDSPDLFRYNLVDGSPIALTNDKLYVLDVWVSTPSSSATNFPQMRIALNTGSQYAEGLFFLTNATVTPSSVGADAKPYSVAFKYDEAFEDSEGTPGADTAVFIDFLQTNDQSEIIAPVDLVIERVVLRSYDAE